MSALIPKEILDTLPDLYASTDTTDPICHVKLFTPDSNWTWYIIEHSKEDGVICYGYVQGLENELGYLSLEEIASVRGALNLPVERDLFFEPTRLSKIMNRGRTETRGLKNNQSYALTSIFFENTMVEELTTLKQNL